MNQKSVQYLRKGLADPRTAIEYAKKQVMKPFTEYLTERFYGRLVVTSSELQNCCPTDDIWYLDHANHDVERRIPDSKIHYAKGKLTGSDTDHSVKEYTLDRQFVCALENVSIVGDSAIGITEHGKVLADTSHWNNESYHHLVGKEISSTFAAAPSLYRSVIDGLLPKTEKAYDTIAIVQGNWDNYYHWTLEHLLKLRGVEHYENVTGRDVTLLTPPDPSSFIIETLELLGYFDNCVEWDGRPIKTNTLVLPSFPQLTRENVQWLRNRMRDSVATDNSGPDWVYISRQNESTRRVRNYPEIADILHEYDIKPVDCAKLSVAEQVQLFSTVDGIVAPHGAGLTNMVWGENVDVVSIFNRQLNSLYYILAQVLDHEFTAIRAAAVGDAINLKNQDIVVDPDAFETVLRDHVG